jgi:hypothetical protein
MQNLLAVCSLLLATLAAVAANTPLESMPDDPVFVQALASAPTASVAEAKSHFDGRVAPAAAVATNRVGNVTSCEYGSGNGQVRFMQRGPVRRSIAWLFRRRCR